MLASGQQQAIRTASLANDSRYILTGWNGLGREGWGRWKGRLVGAKQKPAVGKHLSFRLALICLSPLAITIVTAIPHFCFSPFSLTGWLPVAGNVGLTITVRQGKNGWDDFIRRRRCFLFLFFISYPTGVRVMFFVLTTISQSAGLSRMRENETDAVLVGPPEINVEEDFEAAAVGFW